MGDGAPDRSLHDKRVAVLYRLFLSWRLSSAGSCRGLRPIDRPDASGAPSAGRDGETDKATGEVRRSRQIRIIANSNTIIQFSRL